MLKIFKSSQSPPIQNVSKLYAEIVQEANQMPE